MGIEEQIDRLIDLGEDIKSRLDLLLKLASDHFADANKMVAEEPAKEAEPSWEPKVGDWVRVTRPSDWNGWVAPLWQVDMNRFDGRVGQIENQLPYGFTIRGFYGKCGFLLRWHRDWLSPAEPPAKEPPKKWRILEPGEVVCSGTWVNAKSNPPSDPPGGDGWVPADARLIGGEVSQSMGLYFARPVVEETAKEAEPEYREPVLPADAGKQCEFSDDGDAWITETLFGFTSGSGKSPWESENCLWEHARIKKEA